jgi:DNA modification methylase
MIDRITEQPFCQTRVSGSTFVNADCFDVFPFIEDKSIDAIICDLPYGTTACAWDIIIPFEKLWKEYDRVLKDKGSIILTASQPFTSILLMSNLKWFSHEWIWEKEMGSNFMLANKQPLKIHESILVFNRPINEVKNDFGKYSDIRDYFQEERKKTNLSYKEINEKCFGSASNGGGMASNILTSHKKGWSFPSKEKYEALQKIGICNTPYEALKNEYLKAFEIDRTYNPIKTGGKPYVIKQGGVSDVYGNKENNITTENNGDRFPTSILKIKRDKEKVHPTAKPLELMEYLVKTYTNEGDMVLDNTMGSGTTNLACIKLNRKSIGIEKEKQYYDVAVRRASEYCH